VLTTAGGASNDLAAAEQPQQQDYGCDHEKNINESVRRVRRERSQHPHRDEDNADLPQHFRFPRN